MDELLFRSSQKLENLQYQLGIAATEGKKVLVQLSAHTSTIIKDSLNSPQSIHLQESVKNFWVYVIHIVDELKCNLLFHINPRKLFIGLSRVFGSRWSRRDVYFGCAGILIGGVIGVGIGFALRNNKIFRYMQAVQCTSYCGVEGALVVEDALAPIVCGDNEVLVSVKAGSVQVIDADICRGYGKVLRKILSSYCQYSKTDLPVTLGRDCAGVIVEIGRNVKRFEVGDEVWLTSPFWAPGTLSQYVLSPEYKIGKKPGNIGFEAAASLPYAGSLALFAIHQASLDANNTKDKRIFIQGGCTPVGCVLIQILKHWGAHITTSCFKKALPVAEALGANDVIPLAESQIKTKNSINIQLPEISKESLMEELQSKEKFDFIVNTRYCGVTSSEFRNYLISTGFYVSTVNKVVSSDTFDSLSISLFSLYVKIKCIVQTLLGYSISNFGETHMCYTMLDELASMVEEGHVKTLVQKVHHIDEIEKALHHIQSTESIGNTVITFR